VRPPLSLKGRALQWLSQREHSRIELRRKLMRAARLRDEAAAAESEPGGPAERAAEVESLLDWLTEHRYLSEARFVESRVHARAARFGQRRIAQELSQHGATLDTDTLARLRASEFERAQALWTRRFGAEPAADAAMRAKQMRFLAGRGFASDVIYRVVKGSDND
jgi:regulatory protein